MIKVQFIGEMTAEQFLPMSNWPQGVTVPQYREKERINAQSEGHFYSANGRSDTVYPRDWIVHTPFGSFFVQRHKFPHLFASKEEVVSELHPTLDPLPAIPPKIKQYGYYQVKLRDNSSFDTEVVWVAEVHTDGIYVHWGENKARYLYWQIIQSMTLVPDPVECT